MTPTHPTESVECSPEAVEKLCTACLLTAEPPLSADYAGHDLREAVAMLRALSSRLSELERDAARLDYLEAAANEGGCPGLINDDNGHWTVTEDGIQSVDEGEGPHDTSTSFWVEAGKWRGSVREALDAYIGERNADLAADDAALARGGKT